MKIQTKTSKELILSFISQGKQNIFYKHHPEKSVMEFFEIFKISEECNS